MAGSILRDWQVSIPGMLVGFAIGYTIGYLDASIAGKSPGERVIAGLWGGVFGALFGAMAGPFFAALGKASHITQMSVLGILAALLMWSTENGVNDAVEQGNPDLVTYRYTVGYMSILLLPFAARVTRPEFAVVGAVGKGEPIRVDLSRMKSMTTKGEIASFEASLEEATLPAIEGVLDVPRTPEHVFSQQFLAELFRITPGVKRVGMKVRLSRFSRQSHTPDIEPDVMALWENGTIDMVEIRSPGQTVAQLTAKLQKARNQMAPQKRGRIFVVEPGKPGEQ